MKVQQEKYEDFTQEVLVWWFGDENNNVRAVVLGMESDRCTCCCESIGSKRILSSGFVVNGFHAVPFSAFVGEGPVFTSNGPGHMVISGSLGLLVIYPTAEMVHSHATVKLKWVGDYPHPEIDDDEEVVVVPDGSGWVASFVGRNGNAEGIPCVDWPDAVCLLMTKEVPTMSGTVSGWLEEQDHDCGHGH